MFKLGSFEDEIMQGMQKKLVSSQLENDFSFGKLSKAAEFISTAAEILDDTGFSVEADMLTEVLKRLADEQDADVYPSTPHDTTEEVLTASHFPGDTASPDQVIVEPLEQEIEVAPRVTAEEKRLQDMAVYINAMGKKKV